MHWPKQLDRTSMSVLKCASSPHSNPFVTYVKDHSDEVITFVCVYKDGKYRQMALTGFGTQTTELGL